MTTQTESTSLTAKTLNWIKQQLSSKLPLSGGTMTGPIRFLNGRIYDQKTSDISQFYSVAVNDDGKDGAFLTLRNVDCPAVPGGFGLYSRKSDGSLGPGLWGKSDGTLTWNGHSVITKYNSNDNGETFISGGTASANGARVVLRGKDHGSYPGVFDLTATDGNSLVTLTGKPDGTLFWNNKKVAVSGDYVPSKAREFTYSVHDENDPYIDHWMNSNSGYFCIHAGTNESNLNGAYLSLSGIDREGFNGFFRLSAGDGTKQTVLEGRAQNNSLTWGGKNIVRSVNNVTANSSGNVALATVATSGKYSDLSGRPSIPATPKAYVTSTYHSGSSWYRKWSDGFIEQGGVKTFSSGSDERTFTASLNTAFSGTSYIVICQDCANTRQYYMNSHEVTSRSTSSFTIKVAYGEGGSTM